MKYPNRTYRLKNEKSDEKCLENLDKLFKKKQ